MKNLWPYYVSINSAARDWLKPRIYVSTGGEREEQPEAFRQILQVHAEWRIVLVLDSDSSELGKSIEKIAAAVGVAPQRFDRTWRFDPRE